jgi:hypothetical protein
MARKNKFKLFVPFLTILGRAQMDPKTIYKDPQVGRIYGPLSELKNKPLTKLLGPFLLEETIQNNQKTSFVYCFWPFWGYLGTPKWTQKGTQRLQVAEMYGPMSKLKNKPHTK